MERDLPLIETSPKHFWLRQEAQEVTLSVCVSVCDICEFFTLSKRELLRLVVKLRLGSGSVRLSQAQSGSNSGSVTQALTQ